MEEKGIPFTSRIAFLDTRFFKYEDASIANVQTTLNDGTVVLAFFPNFNVPLADPHLLSAFKVQIEIGGATQISTTSAATLHYQMAYRVQNHDIFLPTSTDEALFLTINSPHQASCIQVSRQILRPDLIKLLPASWVTNYERRFHTSTKPVQSTVPIFKTNSDGTVEISFPTTTTFHYSHFHH